MPGVIRALLFSAVFFTGWAYADPTRDKAAADQAWARGAEHLAQAETQVKQLNEQLTQLLIQPTDQQLAEARRSWQQAHLHWQEQNLLWKIAQVSPVRFAELRHWLFQIDALELQPGYLDSLPDYPFSGLVNDLAVPLTIDSLRQQHGLTDLSEVALGFHALELLLWGVEGSRPATDFALATQLTAEQRKAGYALKELPNNRRRELLKLTGQILQQDLAEMHKQWKLKDSRLGRSYWRLKSAQRLPLMRRAAQAELLAIAQNMPTSFAQAEGFTTEDTRQLQLRALRHQLTQGEPSLISVLLAPEKMTGWIERLDSASQQLLDEGTREAAISNLKALAEELNP